MAADKIQENGNGNKNQNKTLEAVFKEAHDYLENLEKNIAKLLKKFHLNNGSFDGDIDKKTATNHIEEVYQEKILKLKEDLIHNKKTLNKQALVSSLISMSMQAQGQALGEISQLARKELKGKDLAEFEKEKINLIKDINTNEFQELRKDLVETSNKLGNYGEFIVESKEMSERDYLKQKSIFLLEKRLKKQIGQREFEAGINQVMQESGRLSIEHEVIKTFANKIKEIDLSQAKKAGERSMTSGILPLGMIMTPGLKRVIPILPAVIGVGIWARLMHGSAMDKTMAVGETALYIAPITGTAMSGRDTYIAWEKYQKGEAEMGDVVANGVGTVVSAGFDVATVFLAVTGVGAPAAVGSNALRISAKESTKLGIKKIASIFTKEAVEKGTTDGFVKTSIKFVQGKKEFITSSYKELGAKEFFKRTTQQAIKETGEGIWNIASFKSLREMDNALSRTVNIPFKAVDKVLAKPKLAIVEKLEAKGIIKSGASERLKSQNSAAAFREINHELNALTRDNDSQLKIEEETAHYKENLSSKKTGDILNRMKTLTEKGGNELEIKDIIDSIKKQDEHIGNSLEIVKKIEELIINKQVNDIKGLLDDLDDLPKTKIDEITSKTLDEILKSSNGKISEGLYKYLEETVNKIKSGEDFSISSGNYMELQNKIWGADAEIMLRNDLIAKGKSEEEVNLIIDKATKEYNGIKGNNKDSIHGYAGNYFKILRESLSNDMSKLSGNKSDIFFEGYLNMIRESEKSGYGQLRTELILGKYSEGLKGETGYENIIDNLLSRADNQKSLEYIVKHTDLSLITNPKIKEKIVQAGLDSLNKLDPKEQINQLKHLSFYSDYKEMLLAKINPEGVNGIEAIKYYGIIKKLVKETKSNRDLLVLLDFTREHKFANLISGEKGLSDRGYVENRIKENIQNNTQINYRIGEQGKALTKEEFDGLFRDISKLDSKKFKEIVEIIAKKIDKTPGKDINRKIAEKIIPLIESHEVAAKFCKEFQGIETKISITNKDGIKEEVDIIMDKRIKEYIITDTAGKNRYSIEYRIKFLEELAKNGEDIGKLKEDFAKNLIDENLNSKEAFAVKIDNIEHLFKSELKSGDSTYKTLKSRINDMKNTSHYKDISNKIDDTIVILLDTDRAFSDRYIKDLKNSGEISYKTLGYLEQAISNGKIVEDGKVIKEFDEIEISKLKIVKEKVEKALNEYELNLFNAADYRGEIGDSKAEYLYSVIDQVSGWKLTNGAESGKELSRTIVKQLNVIKNNFHIEESVINSFLETLMKKRGLDTFNVETKIHLLKTLEKAHIIKPSIEQKLEYIIALDSTSLDMRNGISYIQDYTKNFDEGLKDSNVKIKGLKADASEFEKNGDNENFLQVKENIKKYIETTINDRVPVERDYLKGKKLREGVDYVTIDGKIYITEVFPSRYFISQMISTKDQKQKESYMELIYNKNEFGEKSIKEYFNNPNIDISTKILLTYHNDLKYDLETAEFLKSVVKTHTQEVAYAISKRRDLQQLLSKAEGKNIEEILTPELLSETIGRKLSPEEFNKIKDLIIKMTTMTNNPNFNNLITAIRAGEEVDENTIWKLDNPFNLTIEQLNKLYDFILGARATVGDSEQNKILVSILKDPEISKLVNDMKITRAEKEEQKKSAELDGNLKLSDKLENTNKKGFSSKLIESLDKLGANISDVINNMLKLMEAGKLKEIGIDRLTKLFDFAKSDKNSAMELGKSFRDNPKLVEELIKEYPSMRDDIMYFIRLIDSNEEEKKETKFPAEIENMVKSASPEQLKAAELEGNLIKTNSSETETNIGGKNIKIKTILGLLVTFGIMTRAEANDTAQDIESSWLNSPEYKKFNELGGEKSQQALEIRENTVKKLAGEKLKPFIDGFDERIRDRNREKINSYPATIQVILSTAYDKGFPLIKDKSQRNLNIFNSGLITYIDQVYNGTGKAEQAAGSLIKRFPEFEGSPFQKTILEIGQNIDSAALNINDIEKRKKIIEKLKSI